jgi:hypothetical protein
MTGKFYQNMLLASVHVYTNLPVKLKTNLNKTKTKLQQNSSKFAYLIGSKMLLPKSTAAWLMWLSYKQPQHGYPAAQATFKSGDPICVSSFLLPVSRWSSAISISLLRLLFQPTYMIIDKSNTLGSSEFRQKLSKIVF